MDRLKTPVCPRCGARARALHIIRLEWDHDAQKWEDPATGAETGSTETYECLDCDWSNRLEPNWYTMEVPS